MANTNAPSGFKPGSHGAGGTSCRRRRYHIASAYGSNMVTGDIVELASSGNKNVQRPAAVTDFMVGVFDGCFYLDPNQSAPQYNRLWPAAQVTVTGSVPECFVYDDPFTLFEAQMSNAFVIANIGLETSPILGTENTSIKISTDSVDSANIGTNTTLRIEDIVNRPDNAAGQYARVLVRISKHVFGPTLQSHP